MSRWRVASLGILILFLFAVAAAYMLLWAWPLHNPHPMEHPQSGSLAFRNVRLYPSPDADAIEHATVVIRDGLISAAGPDVSVPAGTQVLSCDGCVITAGFWNTHIHFTQAKWDSSAWKDAEALNTALEDMLTSRGFTTVVDASSDLRNTISLRRRIASGDLRGPFIYTAGSGFYPPNGIPFYIKDTLPKWMLRFIPQPETPAEAAKLEEQNVNRGADLLKLFTGSYVAHNVILPMPEAIAKAAVDVAHRHGQLAYSHPSNLSGTLAAMRSGVDILAHAPDTTDGIDNALLREIVAKHMAMIPTLHMFASTVTTKDSYLQPIYQEVRSFHSQGGELLFGTDVGYMRDYDTTGEYEALQKCGLTFRDMLRMLTTSPSARFGVSDKKGSIAPGKAADLVALESDPANNVQAFAHVRYTIRNGAVLYDRHHAAPGLQ